jgi:predicted CXXCH cytochrome family protein
LLLSKFIHDPVDGDGCSDCHNPHASDNTRLLALTFPGGNYTVGEVDSFALCFDCHDSELLEEADSESATGFRNGTTNLHYLHINQKKGRSCINCHDVHAANSDHLLAEEVHFGKWKMPLNFKQSENGGSCLPGCHEEKKYEQ